MDKVGERKEEDKTSDRSPTAGLTANVLFVDMDGTLIRTDLLYESLLVLLKQSIGGFFRAFLKLPYGRDAFKKAVSESGTPDVRHLPYRKEVLEFISERRLRGQPVILATSTYFTLAQKIADEVGYFDGMLLSEGKHSLKGAEKLKAIKKYCHEHRHAEFDYLGDSIADLPIWREARGVYMVAASPSLTAKVREFTEPEKILGTYKSAIGPAVSALRPRQWLKNILVFLPLVTSHKAFSPLLLKAAGIAFLCFCLCTSAVYLINDLVDMGDDRRHPIKQKRPFASGYLPISWGLPLAGALLIVGFVLSGLALPTGFSIILAIYFLITCVYSLFAKRIAILDVFIIAGLYTTRVFAGGSATSIVISEWLAAFCMFLFVSLAFSKRYAELERLSHANEEVARGRDYSVFDISLIEVMGCSSGYIAVLVLALYVTSEQMKELYGNPWPLLSICPILMYWISRVWVKAKRGELSEDPIVFALRDRVSVYVGAVVLVLLFAAAYL